MIFPHRIKKRTTTRAKLSMLLKRVWVRRRRGRSVKAIKAITEVKKRHMKTGTYAAIMPSSSSRTITALLSITQGLLILNDQNNKYTAFY